MQVLELISTGLSLEWRPGLGTTALSYSVSKEGAPVTQASLANQGLEADLSVGRNFRSAILRFDCESEGSSSVSCALC